MSEEPETLILSVRLASGRFVSELKVPLLDMPEPKKKAVVEQWLDLIQTGFRIGATSIDADLGLAGEKP